MDTKALRNYLQTVYNVESRIYELEQIKAKLDKLMTFSNAPDKRLALAFDAEENEYADVLITDAIEEAEDKEDDCYDALNKLERRVKPVAKLAKPLPPSSKATKVVDIISLVLAILGVAILLGGCMFASVDIVPAVLIGVMGVLVLSIPLVLYVGKKKALVEYNQKLAAYTEDQERINASQQAYEARLAEAKARISEATLQLTTLRREALSRALATADTNLRSVQQALSSLYMSREQLYASDTIFPKYRNLPAVATMLEYLQAGRCTELEGAHGAYNLYESESRADLIIVKLDKVLDKLDRISQVQYNLYHAVTKTNKLLETMSGQMKDILRAQQQQLEISAVTASCTAAVAANTQAIKYLTLIN